MLDIVAIAKKIIDKEIKGLRELENSLGETFINAIELIRGTKGKLIISGMGKSGYVAKKVASTFASTGTPAIFIHPSEAGHGDLGMLSQNDTVILYSNSGETQELKAIIHYCNRFKIPIIGITRAIHSSLAKSSNLVITLPEVNEAGPIAAPTTSTTMMIALGDALAITICEINGFSADDFKLLHPGGSIGMQLVKVQELMHNGEDIPLVRIDCPATEMIIEMTKKRMGCVGVTDKDGRLIGIVTDGDLRRHIDLDIKRTSTFDFMTYNPITVTPDLFAARALSIMNDRAIQVLFVTENDKAIGIIHMHDLLRAGII
jgi:arabinose-5-phosphate isomerase